MKKNFPRQNLCSGAFGGNNRPYTKQRARHGSPFLEPPPPPPSPGAHAIPPPAKQFSGRQGGLLGLWGRSWVSVCVPAGGLKDMGLLLGRCRGHSLPLILFSHLSRCRETKDLYTRVHPWRPVYTHVPPCIPMHPPVYPCTPLIPMYPPVYPCSPLKTHVPPCIPHYTRVYLPCHIHKSTGPHPGAQTALAPGTPASWSGTKRFNTLCTTGPHKGEHVLNFQGVVWDQALPSSEKRGTQARWVLLKGTPE